ncbi:unnamed protein product [Trifolium pratense]|uniref:Uncharacterized protein n=1 Tax=Trifolium pratense TaxID=57577 RepID=A0ACB0K9L6_TRIPR|nr:unnamed protein product [Trifolium pratense]
MVELCFLKLFSLNLVSIFGFLKFTFMLPVTSKVDEFCFLKLQLCFLKCQIPLYRWLYCSNFKTSDVAISLVNY